MLLSDFHYFTFLILGRVFASSVRPFVVAISNPAAAAKAHLSLSMGVRSNYFIGDLMNWCPCYPKTRTMFFYWILAKVYGLCILSNVFFSLFMKFQAHLAYFSWS